MTLKLTPTTNDILNDPLKPNGQLTGTFSGGYVAPPGSLASLGTLAAQGHPETLVPQPQPVKQPLKIAIIGTAPSSRGLGPYADPTWKIWACSAGNMQSIPRVDAWFEIHSNLLWPEHEAFGKPYIEWLNKQTFPVYMQDNALVPRAMPLPRDELVAEFGRYFFTSSFAWMMAFAIKSGADEIGLWGVDMASKDEYILQRSGGHFFIQEAKRRGIKVTLPKESDLLQPPPLYGFDDSTPFLRKIMVRKKELNDRLTQMRPQRDQMNSSIIYLEGALEDIEYIISIWGGAQTHPGI